MAKNQNVEKESDKSGSEDFNNKPAEGSEVTPPTVSLPGCESAGAAPPEVSAPLLAPAPVAPPPPSPVVPLAPAPPVASKNNKTVKAAPPVAPVVPKAKALDVPKAKALKALNDFKVAYHGSVLIHKKGDIISDPSVVKYLLENQSPVVEVEESVGFHVCPTCLTRFTEG